MYRNSYQRGMLTIFFSVGSKPLNIWDTYTKDGYITRFLDQDIKSMVLEIGGTNVSTTYMTCPKGNKVLGITMPFLVMIVKNLKKYFTFEVTILDETGTRRRFRVSNFQSSTQILPLCTVMPIGLSDGWNQIQFNLAEFTNRAYKKQFVEVQKLKINANIRLRRIYFTEKLVPEDQLPPEYKLYFPLPSKLKKSLTSDSKNKVINAEPVPPKPEEKIETMKTEDAKVSTTEIVKPGSKNSEHSVSKIKSNQTSGIQLQETIARNVTSKTSIINTPEATNSNRSLSKTEIEKTKSDSAQIDELPPSERNPEDEVTTATSEILDNTHSNVEAISSTNKIDVQEGQH